MVKRKREEEIDLDSLSDEERDIEQEFSLLKAAKRRRKPARPMMRYLQLLYNEIRDVDPDDEYEYSMLLGEIMEYEEELEKLGISMKEHSMLPFRDSEEDEDMSQTTGKRIRFSPQPDVAFYKVKNIGQRTQLPRHESLEELSRHQAEINAAMSQAMAQPKWIAGGGNGGFLSGLFN